MMRGSRYHEPRRRNGHGVINDSGDVGLTIAAPTRSASALIVIVGL